MANLTRPEFIQIATLAAEQAGIAYDPKTQHIGETNGTWWLRGLEDSPLLDVRAGWSPSTHEDLSSLTPDPITEPYSLNGMLRQEDGVYDVIVPTRPTPVHRVQVGIVSSPKAVNETQRLLGLQPGHDSFEIVRYPKKGEFSPKEWAEGFANKTVPVAGFCHWFFTGHDMFLNGHIQSWLGTPPDKVANIADRAAEVSQKPDGDKARLLPDEKSLAIALDQLELYTGPFFKIIGQHSPSRQKRASALAQLKELVELRLLPGAQPKEHALKILRQTRQMQHLGIIAPHIENSEAVTKALRATNMAFVRHIVDLHLRAEEVKPTDDLAQRRERLAFLKAIQRLDVAA